MGIDIRCKHLKDSATAGRDFTEEFSVQRKNIGIYPLVIKHGKEKIPMNQGFNEKITYK